MRVVRTGGAAAFGNTEEGTGAKEEGGGGATGTADGGDAPRLEARVGTVESVDSSTGRDAALELGEVGGGAGRSPVTIAASAHSTATSSAGSTAQLASS